jgi:Ca2+-binding RTX toxin-like protein
VATIVGTTGNDPQLADQPSGANTIFGDKSGSLFGVGGNDRIFGLDRDDELVGDANAIGENGRGGNDQLYGGSGSDSLYGDARLALRGVGGDDLLIAGPADSARQKLYGDAFDLLAGSRGGNDRLEGGDEMSGDAVNMVSATGGRDAIDARDNVVGTDIRLFGDALNTMSGTSIGGGDTLWASSHGSRLAGDAAVIQGTSRGGDDLLNGDGAGDLLFGDASLRLENSAIGGDDVLRGRQGFDELFGDAPDLIGSSRGGDDRLYSGAGDDRLWGDGRLAGNARGGNDTFNFAGSFGNDKILDYRDGEDQISFNNYLRADVTVEVSGSNTVISAIGGDTVTLVGFTGSLSFGTDIVFGP